MKFLIQRSAVLPALNQALETCSAGGKSNGAYSDFLIEVDEANLRITSINSHAQQTVQLMVRELEATDESFTVTGKSFVDFLRQCHDEEIKCTYSTKNHALQIASTTRKMKYAFTTGNADEFQPITFQPGKQTFTVPGHVLAAAFGYTHPATNRESAQRPFTAVKLIINGDKLIAESTDRSRIALYEAEIPDTGAEKYEALIPREVAESLSKILVKIDEVTLRPCNRHVVFEWADTELVTSLETDEQNEFVSLSEFFNNPVQAECRISREDLIRSAKLASLLDTEAEIYITCSANGLELKTVENEVGAGLDTLPATEIVGESTCCLPLKHFMKAVESCDEAWVLVKWSQIDNGEIGCSIEDGNGSLKYYIFPVRSRDYDEE